MTEPKMPLQKARMHLRNFEIPASVNAARRAAEQELKRLLPPNLIFDEKSQTFQCDLNGLIGRYCKFAKDINFPNVIPHLQDERKLLLNPFSHDDIETPFYRSELELTIQELEALSEIGRRIIIDSKDLHNKEYSFNMEKDGNAYGFTIVFKERFYLYEYHGNQYSNSPRIDVKRSCITDIDCKEWGLKKFYKKACHHIYHSTDGVPDIMDCLKEI